MLGTALDTRDIAIKRKFLLLWSLYSNGRNSELKYRYYLTQRDIRCYSESTTVCVTTSLVKYTFLVFSINSLPILTKFYSKKSKVKDLPNG